MSTKVSEKSTFFTTSSPIQPDSARLKSVSLHFQDSLQRDDFIYHLSPLSTLDAIKKVAIYNALKGSKAAEVCMGYAEVEVGSGKERLVAIIGSQSLIIVNKDDYGCIIRRINVTHIRLISLEPRRLAAIFHIRDSEKDSFNDLLLSSDKLEDILTAVELASYELTGECIGAQVCESNSAFLSGFNRLSDTILEQYTDTLARRITEVTAKYGLIGEVKLYLKQAGFHNGQKEEKRTVLVTTQAVYCLDEGFGCFSRVELKGVRAVTAVTGKDLLIVEGEKEEQIWTLPAVVGDCIIRAAHRVGNDSLRLSWKSTKSFLSERASMCE